MSFIPHYINVYGNRFNDRERGVFQARHFAINYKHRILAAGWFDSAECEIAVKADQADKIFENYIGDEIKVFVDNPMEPIFEGFIERITYQVGSVVLTRSVENMQNRVNVTFFNQGTGATTDTDAISGKFNNTASQALYGVKEASYQGNINYSTDTTSKTTLRDTRGSLFSYPQVSTALGADKPTVIKLNIKGFYHYFNWLQHKSTATAVIDAGTQIARFVGADAGSKFEDWLDISSTTKQDLIEANTSFNVSRERTAGETYWEIIQQIYEAGDGTNQWIAGVSPTDPNLGTRRLYYRQANTQTAYITRAFREQGVFRDAYGGAIVPAWLVRPDCRVFIADILPFYVGDPDNDPRLLYVEAVEYDAEQQRVQIQGGDDATIDGAFKFNRYFKRAGQRFGAPPLQRT